MKKLIFIVGLILSGNVFAQDCCKPQSRVVEFRCVSPCDVFKGVGCYGLGVTKRVVHGVGEVITAPFKTRMCLPRPEKYRYHPGYWEHIRYEQDPPPAPMPVPPESMIFDSRTNKDTILI